MLEIRELHNEWLQCGLDNEEKKSHLLPRLIYLISNELYQSVVTVALIIQNQLVVSQLP